MKLAALCFFLFLTYSTLAQLVNAKLDEDPVFNAVLNRQLGYPILAERSGIYATIYVGFRIDENGHVQDIQILNPLKIGYGMEDRVLKSIRKLPSLQLKYEGTYALPIVYALIDPINETKTVRSEEKLSANLLANKTLLKEIQVVGGTIYLQEKKRFRVLDGVGSQKNWYSF